jgi:hypothetical protein
MVAVLPVPSRVGGHDNRAAMVVASKESLNSAMARGRTKSGFRVLAAIVVSFLIAGCDRIPVSTPAPLFYLPLTVDGVELEPAFVDTGGDFEVLLKESLHLRVVGQTTVLAFSGVLMLPVTEPFEYTAGGVSGKAPFAIVGLPSCACNGVGVHFLRKSGRVLRIDFETMAATLEDTLPDEGRLLRFEEPPRHLPDFPSSFVSVVVGAGTRPPAPGEGETVLALIDTGARTTVMRRGIAGTDVETGDSTDVTIDRGVLGTLAARVSLYDSAELPDMIIGTDAMRAWGTVWYFAFESRTGSIVVFPRGDDAVPPGTGMLSAGR